MVRRVLEEKAPVAPSMYEVFHAMLRCNTRKRGGASR